jgi:hypothetical protein
MNDQPAAADEIALAPVRDRAEKITAAGPVAIFRG